MSDKPSTTAVGAWTALVRAEQAVLGAVEGELKAAGFPPLACYDALLELARGGTSPLRPRELQRRMLLAQYSVSRLIDRLEAVGYVAKRPCPEDGRGSLVAVTAKGRTLLKAMWPLYARAIQRHVGSKLKAGEAADLARLLGKLTPPPPR